MEEINSFIKTIMEKDLKEGKVSQIVTCFRHALKRESPKREKLLVKTYPFSSTTFKESGARI